MPQISLLMKTEQLVENGSQLLESQLQAYISQAPEQEDFLVMFKRRQLLVSGQRNLAHVVVGAPIHPKRLEGAGVEVNLDIACTFMETCLTPVRHGAAIDVRLILSSVQDYWLSFVTELSEEFDRTIENDYKE